MLLSAWLLLAALPAGGAEAPQVRLAPVPGASVELTATVGEPLELTIAKYREDVLAGGEPLTWTLEDPASGELEVLDEVTRSVEDAEALGTGRARFTPDRAGVQAVRVETPVVADCTAADCRRVAHRFRIVARAADAPLAESARSGPAPGLLAGGAAGLAALAALSGSGDDDSSARTLAIVGGNGQGGLANTAPALPLQVLALDGGRVAPGVTIQWSASGGASLSAASSQTGADGRAEIIVTSLGPGPGPVTVTATRADQPSASLPFTLVISIGGIDKVSGDNQTTPVDTTTAAPLVVRTLLDGAPQAGVAVQWQVVSGTGTVVNASAASDANGLAQAFVDMGPFAGTVTVRASRVDSPALSQIFTLAAVELRDLAIVSGNGQNGAQDANLPNPLVVQATDDGLPDAGVTVFWTASGGATLSANSTVTDAGGLTDVTVTSLGFGLDPVTVTASRADQPGISVSFDLDVLPPSLAVVGGAGQSGLAGTPAAQPMQVLLLDGAGQPMGGQTVSWSVISGSATLSSSSSVTDGAGVASVAFSYGNFPGAVVIRASAFFNGVSATANATGLAPGGLAAASGDGQTGDPGDMLPQPLVVQLVDLAPDLSGVPITFIVVSGSATVAPTTVATDVSGQASAQVTLGLTPGPVVIQASAPGGVVTQFNATVTGTLVVTNIAASSGNAQSLTPGTASAPMVVDLIGNGVPVVGQTVTWSTNNGTMASPTTVTDANGRTSNTVTVAGAGTVVVTASFPSFAEFVGSTITFTHNAGLAALPNLSINEASVAEALDAACLALVGAGPLTPAEQDLLEQCQTLIAASGSDPAAVGEALTAMLPDVAQSQADAGRAATGAQFENLNSRMVGLRSGMPMAQMSFSGLTLAASGGRLPLEMLGLALLNAEPASVDVGLSEQWGVFVSGNIGRGQSEPTRLTPRYDFDIDGITAGMDYRFNDALVVGVALGYTRQDTRLADDLGAVDMQGLSLSGYSTWYRGNDWYLDSVLTLGRNQYDHQRRIQYVLPGSVVDQQAVANSDGTTVSATVTFGRDFAYGGWTLGTYGRAGYSRLGFDAFQEEVDQSLNGNGLALRIESRTVTGVTSTLGGKAAYAYSASWGVLLPQLEVEWVRDYGSDAEAFRGYFVDDPSNTPILVLGDDLDNNYFRVGLGLSMALTGGRSGFVTYERLVGRSGISQQSVSLGFRWSF